MNASTCSRLMRPARSACRAPAGTPAAGRPRCRRCRWSPGWCAGPAGCATRPAGSSARPDRPCPYHRLARGVAQLVAHVLWEHEVAGSSPAAPTTARATAAVPWGPPCSDRRTSGERPGPRGGPSTAPWADRCTRGERPASPSRHRGQTAMGERTHRPRSGRPLRRMGRPWPAAHARAARGPTGPAPMASRSRSGGVRLTGGPAPRATTTLNEARGPCWHRSHVRLA